MFETTAGTQFLDENDIIDIIKQHFYRYGQGFKEVRVKADIVACNNPKISLEVNLKPLNPVLPEDRIDQIYYSLLNSCKESTKVEVAMNEKLFDMVKSSGISREDYIKVMKKITG